MNAQQRGMRLYSRMLTMPFLLNMIFLASSLSATVLTSTYNLNSNFLEPSKKAHSTWGTLGSGQQARSWKRLLRSLYQLTSNGSYLGTKYFRNSKEYGLKSRILICTRMLTCLFMCCTRYATYPLQLLTHQAPRNHQVAVRYVPMGQGKVFIESCIQSELQAVCNRRFQYVSVFVSIDLHLDIFVLMWGGT